MRPALAAIAVVAICVALDAAFPQPHGPINDFAGVLNPAATTELEQLVDGVRDATTAEIAIVTVASLDGMSVEEYANKLFAVWGVGKKGKDNGVLVLVAPVEHKMRIEVGYGLEPVLPDGLAGQIIREEMLPRFKADDFNGGILRGTRRVADIVRANHTLTPAEREALSAITRSQRIMLTIVILFFMPFFMGTLGASLKTKSLPGALFGAIFGVAAMSAPFVIPGAGPVMQWLVGSTGILALIIGWRSSAAERRSLDHGARKRKFGWIASLSGPGSKSSSGSRSSSSSGGGFGGGSSGGGGASGSW